MIDFNEVKDEADDLQPGEIFTIVLNKNAYDQSYSGDLFSFIEANDSMVQAQKLRDDGWSNSTVFEDPTLIERLYVYGDGIEVRRKCVRAKEFKLSGYLKVGLEIAEERLRQIRREGWTLEHDDEHELCELAAAAGCYATSAAGNPESKEIPADWPWADHWWKPTTARRNLVKAAALIIAEIERIDRDEDSL